MWQGHGQRTVFGAGDEVVRMLTDSGGFHLVGLVCFSGMLYSDHHCARDLKVPATVLIYWMMVYTSEGKA